MTPRSPAVNRCSGASTQDAPAPRVDSADHAPVSERTTFPLVLILDRLRSAFNVGNLFRLAETTGVREVFSCGYTATPPHPKLAKTARGCDCVVPCRHFATGADAVTHARAHGFRAVAVETVAGAPLPWDMALSFPIAFVLGNEALGVSDDALQCCDACVRLPCVGFKNSLNVANCAAAILYETLRQNGCAGPLAGIPAP